MGTSLYEQFKVEQADPTSLYAKFLAEQKPTTPQAEQRHADYRSGKLGTDVANANAKDMADATATPAAQKVAEAVVSGFPGAQTAVSGYRGLLSLMGVGSETPAEASAQQREDVAKLPAKARIPLQLAGGAPAAALAMGGAALKGASALPTLARALPSVGKAVSAARGMGASGAILGGATAAEQPDADAESVAGGAVLGAAGGKVIGALGRGVANVAQRTGLTDLIGSGLQKISPKLGASVGTRGAVNAAFADRQDILDKLGDKGVSAGKAQLNRIAFTKGKAAELYDAARADQQAITDPRLQALLQDPDVESAFATVRQMRKTQGNPLPRATNLAGTPLDQTGWSAERIARMNELAKARGPLGPVGGVEVPDPQALSMLKRYLTDDARGLNSPLNLKQDHAKDVLGKVTQIRDVLHEVSTPWKQADAFYADAKGQEEAFAHGFDAFRHANNPSGEQLPTHTAEAMLKSIQEPRYAGEPPEALAARADAFRAGVRSAMASDIEGAPITKGAKAALRLPSLSGDQATQRVRALGMGGPTEARPLEQLLATKRGRANAGALGNSNYIEPPVTRYHAIRAGVRSMLLPDVLGTPKAQGMIAARQGNPIMANREIGRARKGLALSELLKQLAAINTGNQINR